MPPSFLLPRAVLWVCLWLAVAPPAWASDPVHKCRGRDGQAYYQATPCDATKATEWVREFPADPPATAAASRPAGVIAARARNETRQPRNRTGPRRRTSSAQGSVISMHRDPVACERAKKARDQAYARLGLKRDFATSRKLDDRVNAACR